MGTRRSLTRRGVLAGASVAGASVALQARTPATAQEVSSAHPFVGAWLLTVVLESGDTIGATSIVSADGSILLNFPIVEAGPRRQLRLRSSAVGAWEATDERTGRYTIVHLLSSPQGEYQGTMTLSGQAVISDDGMTLDEVDAERLLILRDPENAILAEVTGASVSRLTGIRITAGGAGSGVATPEA